mgnify:CR=1 FL=1
MPNPDASGWTVAVTHPDSGRVKTPDVLDTRTGPAFNPGLNAQPEVRIPVRQDDVWLDPVYDDDPQMDVWLDGERLPIDVLRDVERETDRVVLIGVGGVELEQRVRKYYDTIRRHVAAENLITNETSYTPDVDTPQAASASVDVATLDTQSELEDNIRIQPTTPLEVVNGSVDVLPSAYLPDTGDFQSNDGTLTTDSAATGETAIEFAGDGSASWSITTEYDIPVGTDSDAYLAVRARAAGSTNPLSVFATIDGDTAGAVGVGTAYSWTQVEVTDAEAGDAVTAGSHTIGVGVNDPDTDPDDNVFIDRVVLYDNEYSYTFDNTLDANNQLEGPQRFPDVADVITSDFPSQFAVVGGDATADVDTTDPAARLQVSNDSGATYRPNDGTEQDTNSVSASFPDIGSALRARVGLGRYADGSTDTPTTGNAAQSLESITLDADIERLYLLLDEDRDESIADLLTFLTADTRYLWSYQLDANGTPTVVFTQPGQRVADRSPPLEEASVDKAGTTYPRVTVKGSPKRVDGEQFTASETYVDLVESDLIGGTEAVVDADTGTQFTRGADYELDREAGRIRITAESAMSAGTTYEISHQSEVAGTYTVENAPADPRELVRQISGVTTTQQAQQAAFALADELGTPRYAADIVIPEDRVDFDPTEALPLDTLSLPAAATPLEVEGEPELTPRGLAARLGSRDTIEQSLSLVREQLNAVTRRT